MAGPLGFARGDLAMEILVVAQEDEAPGIQHRRVIQLRCVCRAINGATAASKAVV